MKHSLKMMAEAQQQLIVRLILIQHAAHIIEQRALGRVILRGIIFYGVTKHDQPKHPFDELSTPYKYTYNYLVVDEASSSSSSSWSQMPITNAVEIFWHAERVRY
jgi:hypothetical protein